MNIVFALLRAESIKLRRSWALGFAILCPCIALIFGVVLAIYSLHSSARISLSYESWVVFILMLWAGMILTFFVAISAAQLAGFEHQNQQWKHLDALPLPRWATYLAKQTVLSALILSAHVLLLAGMLIAGLFIHLFHSSGGFGQPPWSLLLGGIGLCFGASLFMQAIQHWIAMRFPNIALSIGSVLLGLVGGVTISGGTQGRYYPWSMPGRIWTEWLPGMQAAPRPWLVLAVSLVGFGAVVFLGCLDANRRQAI